MVNIEGGEPAFREDDAAFENREAGRQRSYSVAAGSEARDPKNALVVGFGNFHGVIRPRHGNSGFRNKGAGGVQHLAAQRAGPRQKVRVG
jgi:hypothetical protein